MPIQVAGRSILVGGRLRQSAGPYPPSFGLSRAQLRAKRALDLCAALALLVLFSPVWLMTWLLVRATSPGPAIFKQARIGLHGRKFVLFKFRSMVLAANDVHRDYVRQWIRGGENARQHNGEFKIVNDRRITPVGKFLRKYSLDELPQLLNVLRGDMSMVGPRPAMEYEVAQYQPWQKQRLQALPGITGLWQVSGRNRLSFEQMLTLDLDYIRHWSLRADLRILVRTIGVVLLGTGH